MAAKSLRVLIADGNADSANTTAQLVGIWGYEAWVAYNGPDALDCALTRLPDVVVTEIVLPLLDGIKLASQLRGSATLIALTGMSTESYRRRCFDAGFDHMLIKPADPDDLRRLLDKLASTSATPRLPATAHFAVCGHGSTP